MKDYKGIEVTPEEAIALLQYVVDTMGFSFFANPKAFPALRRSFVNGWNAARAGWTSTSKRYEEAKAAAGFNEVGVVGGATKALMTLEDGAIFRVTQKGVSLIGSPLTQQQLDDRAKLGGTKGRPDSMDNRITPRFRFGSMLTLDVIAPDIIMPAVTDYQGALKALPIPPAVLKRVRKGKVWYRVRNGKAEKYKDAQ